MALQPIVFTPPRRDPSLVQQAIVGTLTGLVRKKLIDEPLLTRREEFFTGEREAGETAQKVRDRRTGVTLPLELMKRTRAFQKGLPIVPGLEDTRLARVRAIQKLDPEFLPSGPPGTLEEQVGRREAGQSLLDDLLAQARVDVTAGQTRQARADWMAGILDRFGVKPSQLPVFMVKDADTGETRMPDDEEMTLRALTHGIQAGEMAQFENDERFVSLKREADALEDRVVPVPAYSAKAELEMLGKITQATPGAENARNLLGVASVLRSIGLVGGAGPSEEWWFTDDTGEEVRAKSEAEFFLEFPAKAQSRIRGTLWARVFFQNPDTFGAAKQAYGLRDAVAEDTYRQITGSVGPPVGFSSVPAEQLRESLGELEAGVPTTSAPKSRAERAESFVSPGARAMIEADSTKVDDLESYTTAFLADPAAYNNAIDQFEVLLALPDDEFAQVLQEFGGLRGEVSATPVPGGTFKGIPAEPIPERDAFRLSVYSLLGVAQVEAQERRKAARQ